MLRDEFMNAALDRLLQLIVGRVAVKDFLKDGEVHELRDAELLLLFVAHLDPAVDIDHHRREDLDLDGLLLTLQVLVVRFDKDRRDAFILDRVRKLRRADRAGLGDHLSGVRAQNVLCEHKAADAVAEKELLVVLIAADLGEVVAARVKEQVLHLLDRAVHRERFARTDLFVQLKKTLVVIIRGVFDERGQDLRLVAEHLENLLVGADAEGADQDRHRNLPRAVNAHVEDVVGVGLILQPRAAVRNHRAGIEALAVLVVADPVINAGRADELADDNTLGAIDNEGARVRHEGKRTHVLLMLFDFAVLFVVEAHRHLERCLIIGVALLALFDRILDFVPAEPEVHKLKAQLARIIFDRGNIREYLLEAIGDKPVVGILLNLDEIRDLQNLLLSLIGHTDRPAGLDRTNSVFLHSTFHPVFHKFTTEHWIFAHTNPHCSIIVHSLH